MSYEEISCAKVKGKKQYRCEWCPEKIEIGELHFTRAYKFCGEFNSGRMHLECLSAMEKSDRDQMSDGWFPGKFKRGEVCK